MHRLVDTSTVRAIVLARLLYATPAWRGFTTTQDCSRIEASASELIHLPYP